MNLASRADVETGGFFVNFNQDCSSLAVGSRNGYSLFSLNSVDANLDLIYHSAKEEIVLVERLFGSSLVAVVSLNAPRKLKVCHFKKGTEICNYSYSNTILAVKLNRSRLVVCLEESLYIHNIRDMKVVHTIRDTPPNFAGLCALASDSDHCYLAYPGSATVGEVQIFDAVNLHAKTMIPAHDSPLAAIAFSQKGTEVATASEKGTVIRVFSVNDGSKLFEFRRGVKRCVTIASLAFSTCSKYLCCSSNTETVHVFKLERSSPEANDDPSKDHWMGYLSRAMSSYLPLALPTQVTDVFTQGRAFAAASLPVAGLRHSCVINVIQKVLRLLVASQDGYLYVYQLPLEGGECHLIKKHDLRCVEPVNPAPRPESLPIGVPTASPQLAGTTYAAAVKGGHAAVVATSSSNKSNAASDSNENVHDEQQ
ncbi:WD repeat domain phosphoinositide-interacting protein 2 [Toxorhynchites rutilus septentrionalis]|uniref:WD repeat domain phosphoinositide-interacting protein 2 n=1 Tax=Toxorhynchites rutilus septentrionalis TaxID=329112 RepID=UPI002479F8A9|nr:WD repeat domain phosphoinositide-interacting protein 2 [Toxorhynchites rutilus septentrionalis]XP_055627551.1 WD repeat domain phosphoinositide-interacting protein 2 [Toxorhynchites rutilus septentrionalis]